MTHRARVLGPLTAAIPLVGLGVGAALSYWGRGAKRTAGIGILGASAGVALARWQLGRLVTETPAYDAIGSEGVLEIRRYAPSVRAETTIEDATWNDALDEGFRRLAGYIFGDNEAGTTHEPAHLAMTSPVVATVGPTPVSPHRTIAFIMPGGETLASLPKPKDSRIHLREVPAQEMAVLRFRGSYSGELPAKKRRELLDRVRDAGLRPIGQVVFAGYDPPTTLPALRRNEVLIEIERRDAGGGRAPAP